MAYIIRINHFFFSVRTVETCNTLLSRDLKRNLFNLFTSWCGQYAKPLGVSSNITATNPDEEKLQFSALQVCIHTFIHTE